MFNYECDTWIGVKASRKYPLMHYPKYRKLYRLREVMKSRGLTIKSLAAQMGKTVSELNFMFSCREGTNKKGESWERLFAAACDCMGTVPSDFDDPPALYNKNVFVVDFTTKTLHDPAGIHGKHNTPLCTQNSTTSTVENTNKSEIMDNGTDPARVLFLAACALDKNGLKQLVECARRLYLSHSRMTNGTEGGKHNGNTR